MFVTFHAADNSPLSRELFISTYSNSTSTVEVYAFNYCKMLKAVKTIDTKGKGNLRCRSVMRGANKMAKVLI